MDFNKYYYESSCSYKLGNCESFAIALSELTNNPLYVVRGYYYDDILDEESYEDCHIVVKSGSKYIDVDGFKSDKELKRNCAFMNEIQRIEIEEISKEEAQYIFSSEGVSEEDITKAKDLILKDRNKYGF